MYFSIKYNQPEPSHNKFLEFYLDSKLNWKQHIALLSNKLTSIVYLLYKISQYITSFITKQTYMGLFLLQVDFGISLSGNSTEWTPLLFI